MQWQVKGPGGVRYYAPEESTLVLRGCTLKNRRSVAEQVNKTQLRDVCGHVACESVEVLPRPSPATGRVVHFDPKVAPYWIVEGAVGPQDGERLPELFSSGRRLRIPDRGRERE